MNDTDLSALSFEELEALALAAEGTSPEAAEELRAYAATQRDAAIAAQEAQQARLDALGAALSKKRQEAVDGRAQSGIEDEWSEDEEAYQGIDDANRGTVATAWSNRSAVATASNKVTQGRRHRSTVFLNITRPYVDAAAARISDMLLPTDDRPWALLPTPIPELVEMVGAIQEQAGQPIAFSQEQVAELAQRREQEIEAGKRAAEAAQHRIDDWLTESSWHGEVRKMLDDAARIGSGALKGPFPRKVRSVAWRAGETGEQMLAVHEEIKPYSRRVDPWNLFPDPACGESIHDGSFVWERDQITAKGLRDLIGVEGYISEAIQAVIEEGPKVAALGGRLLEFRRDSVRDQDQFEIWYFHGTLEREDLEAAGLEMDEDAPDALSAMIVMVNDRVIKAAENPLDTGAFPYDVFPWQRRPGMPWGMGVSRQVRTPQRMINAATRAMMDNSGLSAAPQIVVRRKAIVPADGTYEMTPGKMWFATEEADMRSVSDAITSIVIPSMQAELMGIIQFALKMAEDVTGLPMLLQGQQGSAPNTLGGQQMAMNNASGVLRRIARGFDDYITEPHLRRYYTWLMQYSEDPAEQGDFVIDARGSSALVERDLQNQAILQMGQLVMNPAFGVDPRKWFEESCKAQRLDPRKFMYSEEELQQMAQQQGQQQPPPQLAVAQIRAQTDMQRAQMTTQADMQKAQMMAQADAAEAQMRAQQEQARLQWEAQNAEQQRMLDAQIAQQNLQIKMMEFASKRDLSLEQVKAQLAQTAMKLRTQKELTAYAADREAATAPQVTTPPSEPIGRAPNGSAYAL